MCFRSPRGLWTPPMTGTLVWSRSSPFGSPDRLRGCQPFPNASGRSVAPPAQATGKHRSSCNVSGLGFGAALWRRGEFPAIRPVRTSPEPTPPRTVRATEFSLTSFGSPAISARKQGDLRTSQGPWTSGAEALAFHLAFRRPLV